MRGEVVRWNDDRGWGFIKRDDGAADIFVHQQHIQMAGRRGLEVGARVEFDEWNDTERPEAFNVRVLVVRAAEQHKRFGDKPRATTSLVPRAIAKRGAPKPPRRAAAAAVEAPGPTAAVSKQKKASE